MRHMITGNVTDLGLPAARPVIALKGDHGNEVELGSFLSRNMSGDDGDYVLGLGGYPQNVIVVGLDENLAPRSQPDAIDWKSSETIEDHETEVLTDAPLGFWRLFETAGTSAADASGNVRDGSYIGAIPGSPSLTGSGEGFSAYFANDAVSRVSVPSTLATSTNPDLSFECWYASSVTSRQMNLWDRQDIGTPSRRFMVALHRQGANYAEGYITVFFQGPSSSNEHIVTRNYNPRLTDGVAHHLLVTKVGSIVSIYLDGAWQEVSGTVTIAGPFHNGRDHYIGCGASLLSGVKFEGYMSEVAFYATGLSHERVKRHFASSF